MTEEEGRVAIVGAGPGNPDLLTRKAHRLLVNADTVLHDSLVGDEVLDLIPESAETIYVGKKPEKKSTPQEVINDLMVTAARRGDDVVRLKGGDPGVFGRGGEEAQHLASKGVEFEVVPGVSSFLSAPAAAGFPLTHRELSSGFTVVTGHEVSGKDESVVDWDAMSGFIETGGTLVVLMGVSRIPVIVEELIGYGLSSDVMAAVIENASLGEQRITVSSLDDLPRETREAGVEPPAVIVIGDVVEVHLEVRDLLSGVGATAVEVAKRNPESLAPEGFEEAVFDD